MGLTIDRYITILRFQARHVETGFLLQWSPSYSSIVAQSCFSILQYYPPLLYVADYNTAIINRVWDLLSKIFDCGFG